MSFIDRILHRDRTAEEWCVAARKRHAKAVAEAASSQRAHFQLSAEMARQGQDTTALNDRFNERQQRTVARHFARLRKDAERALEADPIFGDAYYLRAFAILNDKGRSDERADAIADLERALELKPRE